MKIILKGADASENNIGQSEIPISYNAKTTEYLNAIPNTSASLSNSSKIGLNNFFIGLDENNLLSKVERFYIPVFGASDGAVNAVNVSDTALNLPTSGVTYDANGVSLGNNYFVANFTKDWGNSLVGFSNKTAATYVSGTKSIAISNGNFLGMGRAITGSQSGSIINSTDRALTVNKAESTGYMLSSYDETMLRAVIDGEYIEDAAEGNAGGEDVISIGGGSAYQDCGHSLSTLVFSQPMNQLEITILGGLISDLTNAL